MNWELRLLYMSPGFSQPLSAKHRTPGKTGNYLIIFIDNRKKTQYSVLDLLSEKAMAPHSSTFAWKISWTEEPGRLQSMRSLKVGYD